MSAGDKKTERRNRSHKRGTRRGRARRGFPRTRPARSMAGRVRQEVQRACSCRSRSGRSPRAIRRAHGEGNATQGRGTRRRDRCGSRRRNGASACVLCQSWRKASVGSNAAARRPDKPPTTLNPKPSITPNPRTTGGKSEEMKMLAIGNKRSLDTDISQRRTDHRSQ